MNTQVADLSARLLATENLTVVRANADTAYFDVVSRVLTLPIWKDMTPEIEDMMIGHEVGHALYTTDDFIEHVQENPTLKGYINVLEDVRIEKLIKRKYPGMRKRMTEGYRQLNERNFFGASISDIATLNFIDRINIYFKVGLTSGVTFTAEEKQFVIRAEKTETMQQVIDLAKEVYEFSKQQQKQKMESMAGEDSQEEIEYEYEEEDEEIDSNSEVEEFEYDDDAEDMKDERKLSGAGDHNEDKTELESKTDKVFQEKLRELADPTTQYKYYNIPDFDYDPVVDYKTVLRESDVKSYFETRSIPFVENKKQSEIDKFKLDSSSTVNYLVKEFEMKKSAKIYQRTQVAKVGSLDMKKVWSYKLNEDLFKRVAQTPKGKNHGMIFLLDWSGSMDTVIHDTLKQVINLAMFCKKTQIPYRVLAFTTQYVRPHKNLTVYEQPSINLSGNNFSLLELFSSKMTNTEFNTMVNRVLDKRFMYMENFCLGGTPLNESLVWVYKHLGEFIKANNIEKTTLITLSDGQGSALMPQYGAFKAVDYTYDADGTSIRRSIRHYVKDDLNKKNYEITSLASEQTELFNQMIKNRYNVKVLGFYICANRSGVLRHAIYDNIPNYMGSVSNLIDSWRSDFKRNGYSSIKSHGRDELFIIPQNSTKIDEGELNVNSDMKPAALARTLTKFMNNKKTSRVLLNNFVEHVA